MDEFLEAMISREALPESAGHCRYCNTSALAVSALAVWRCKDCVLANPMCRSCMRHSHRDNPFHRIEQWNGSYFRPAELSEVGIYLLIRHHTGEALCDTLTRWCDFFESAEVTTDKLEQDQLRRGVPVPMPGPAHMPEYKQMFNENDIEMDMGQSADDVDDHNDGEDFIEDDEEEIEEDNNFNPNPYLSEYGAGASAGTSTDAGVDPALASATLGSMKIRVVHTNGLHNIPMVCCQLCRGQDALPLDLFAAQMIPASLKRIKTLFTAQVLDMFRLCNLELKASAYQFYQLLRRLTRPMAPAEVLNLYREFRRMSRLWRWMKKLKWAGYAGTNKPVNQVDAGELTIYCPACPQPGINIPDDWKDDPARQVFKRIFVADGNFKADHVRQKNEVDDVWLSEGSGMIPQRQEYLDFLATAIERLTVSASIVPNSSAY